MPKEKRETQHLASATHSVSEDGAILSKVGQARRKVGKGGGQKWARQNSKSEDVWASSAVANPKMTGILAENAHASLPCRRFI